MTVSTVLVTGAGGFVGGRLAHRIALGEPMDPKALVHSPAGAGSMRLARLPIEIETGSIRDADLVADLLADCDGVINCAFGMGSTNVDGTRTLLEEADRAGIESFVHLSSAVVHGHDLTDVDESAPFEPDTEYGEWKAMAERVIRDFEERSGTDLRPAILRPMIVYGPHGDWVNGAVEELREGAVLADGGRGTLNPIYVDNLVDAILLALTDPAADGQAFLAADDDAVTWQQFYEDVGDIVGDHPPVRSMSRREIRARKAARTVSDSVVPPVRILQRVAASNEVRGAVASELSKTPWAEPAVGKLPDRAREAVVGSLSGADSQAPFETLREDVDTPAESDQDTRYRLPSERFVTMQSTVDTVPNRRLKEVLGWEQQVDYAEAMELVEAWLSYAGTV